MIVVGVINLKDYWSYMMDVVIDIFELPKVSIIVPVYKVEMYLQRCIDSIVNQSYKNLEIILIDDGSPDNCGAICEMYASDDDRIKVIHQKNQGLSVARNTGIEIASGKYIVFVDSDDYIALNLVERCVSVAEKKELDLLIFDWVCEMPKGKFEKHEIDKSFCVDRDWFLKGILSDEIQSYAWNKFYKRNLWDKHRFPKGLTFEDLYIMPRVFFEAKRIEYIEEWLYYYNRTNLNSITSHLNAKNKYGVFCALENRLELLKEKEFKEYEDWGRVGALRNAVAAYALNTRQKMLSEAQIEHIKSYCYGQDTTGLILRYKIVHWTMFHCEWLCEVYAKGRLFYENIKRALEHKMEII